MELIKGEKDVIIFNCKGCGIDIAMMNEYVKNNPEQFKDICCYQCSIKFANEAQKEFEKSKT